MFLFDMCLHSFWCIFLLRPQQLKDEMVETTAEMDTLEDEGKNNPRSKQTSIGRKKFNMDPKKGIEYLIEHALLKNTAEGEERVIGRM